MNKNNPFRRVSRLILIVLAAIWMMFEDWVWDSILAVMERVRRLKTVGRFEAFLARQNQYVLLSLFIFPFLIMVPAKLFGLYLIANGKVLRGVSIFVVAKVMITAFITRLFIISKDKLLLITSFAGFYHWFLDKKEWLYSELRKMPAWQTAAEGIKKFRRRLRMKIRQLRKG